ncbi:hypothetical protein B0T19DRAFT_420435 [Cercophora scortea]|uniref:Uncharacterized protein n=1 Tax=Cercophora scortea TaxID=314031 RepID=A0AAE0ILG2_9PEZI|nr:hypothetical protein B0T19DRAFT_420435 [Cercophora scortea]
MLVPSPGPWMVWSAGLRVLLCLLKIGVSCWPIVWSCHSAYTQGRNCTNGFVLHGRNKRMFGTSKRKIWMPTLSVVFYRAAATVASD